MINSVQIRSGS